MNRKSDAGCFGSTGLALMGIALLSLAAPAFCAAETGKTHRIAVIVGNNASQLEDLEPLRFADDDAFKYHHFFQYAADETVLLSRPDEETDKLFDTRPDAAPTKDAVLEVLDAQVEKARRLAEEGSEVVLYFIYSGHGNYDAEGRGFLHLEDGKLTTRDLFYRLVSRSENFNVVLLIDACNASFLVKSRGQSSDRRPAGPTRLNLEDYPNVGLILSSSSTGEVKEWGRYLSGIFSHQVRSALSGLADIDADGKVTFQELASFAESANEAVDNPALRLTPYIRPPLSNPNLALVDFQQSTFRRFLNLNTGKTVRITLYDEDLVRWADAHLQPEFAVRLALPDDQGSYLVEGTTEYHIPASLAGDIKLSDLTPTAAHKLASRGTDRYYLKHLFSTPFGPQYAAAYLDGPYQQGLVFTRKEPRAWYSHKWAWVSVGAGAVLLGVAGFSYGQADAAHFDALGTDLATERASLNDTIDRYNALTVASSVVGSAAILTGVALFVFDHPMLKKEIRPEVGPGFVLRPTPTGAMIEGTF